MKKRREEIKGDAFFVHFIFLLSIPVIFNIINFYNVISAFNSYFCVVGILKVGIKRKIGTGSSPFSNTYIILFL